MPTPIRAHRGNSGVLPAGATTIDLGFTPVAGRVLVLITSAAANQSIAGWTEHRYMLSDGEISLWTRTATGTEQVVTYSQNGPRALAWAALELPEGTTFSQGTQEISTDDTFASENTAGLPEGEKVVLWASSRYFSVPGSYTAEWSGESQEFATKYAPHDGNEGAGLTVGFYEGTATSVTATLVTSGGGVARHKVIVAAYVPAIPDPDPDPDPDPVTRTIAEENQLTGMAPSQWFQGLSGLDLPSFARSTYYEPGQTAQFSVDYASNFTVQILRFGHYAGQGAREVSAPTAATPTSQPDPVLIPGGNGAVTCSAWSVNATWDVPATATPGWYMAIFRNTAGDQHGFSLFCVTDKQDKKPVLIVTGDATWHAAYNGYGGNNVYGAALGIGSTDERAFCSTYDKPVYTKDYVPQTHFLNNTYPYLKWSERMGYEAAHTTIEQIKNDPSILDGRQLIVFVGHNEYVPDAVMTKTKQLLASGQRMVNVAGNDFFWRVKFTDGAFDSASNGRVMWCKKDTMNGPSVGPDAVPGHVGGQPFTTEEDWTGTWQDTRWGSRQPSEDFFGDRFIANGIRADSVQVPAAMRTLPAWRDCTGVQGLTAGQTYSFAPGTLGMEWDHPVETPAVEQVFFSHSTVELAGNAADVNGQNYNTTATGQHHFSLVRTGLGVVANFNSDQWAWALDGLHLRGSEPADANAMQMMLNVVADLGVAPDSASVTSAGLAVPTPVSLTAYGLSSTSSLEHRVRLLAARVAAEMAAIRAEMGAAGPGGEAGPLTLDELTDVDTTTIEPTHGMALVYDSATGLWHPGKGGPEVGAWENNLQSNFVYPAVVEYDRQADPIYASSGRTQIPQLEITVTSDMLVTNTGDDMGHETALFVMLTMVSVPAMGGTGTNNATVELSILREATGIETVHGNNSLSGPALTGNLRAALSVCAPHVKVGDKVRIRWWAGTNAPNLRVDWYATRPVVGKFGHASDAGRIGLFRDIVRTSVVGVYTPTTVLATAPTTWVSNGTEPTRAQWLDNGVQIGTNQVPSATQSLLADPVNGRGIMTISDGLTGTAYLAVSAFTSSAGIHGLPNLNLQYRADRLWVPPPPS